MALIWAGGTLIDDQTGQPVNGGVWDQNGGGDSSNAAAAAAAPTPSKGGILGTGAKVPKFLKQAATAPSGPRFSTTFGDYTTLPEEYKKLNQEDEATYDDYVKGLDATKYEGSKVPDVVSDVKLSDATKAAQASSMNMLKDRTGVQETGEEKLMRLMARQKMENQMQGERGAMADRLKARGAYGSGAELASQLSGQQNLATERQISELGAQANAQRRAMDALEKYSAAGLVQGQQDIAIGRSHDAVSQFNANAKHQDEQFTIKAARELEGLKTSGRAGVTRNKEARTDKLVNTDMGLTGAETTTKQAGANGVTATGAQVINQDEKDAGFAAANDPVFS